MRSIKPSRVYVAMMTGVAILGVVPAPANAQVGMPYMPDQWHVDVTPFFWLAGLDGVLSLGDQATRVDASFGDVAENLDFAFAAHVEASKRSVVLMADASYLNLGWAGVLSDGTPADVDTRKFEGELGAGYRVGTPTRSIGFLGGVRYTNLRLGVQPQGETLTEGNQGWLDPFVGLRLHLDLNEKLPVMLRGDVGGFQVGGADLSWKVTAGAGYRLTRRFALSAGWRLMEVEYRKDDTDYGQFIYDVSRQGLVVAVTLGI
jgi:hypothetical protein